MAEEVASLMLGQMTEGRAAAVDRAVAGAMKDGLLPPGLRYRGRALWARDPDLFRDFVRASPFAHLRERMNFPRVASASRRDSPEGLIAAQLGLRPEELGGA